MNEYKAILLALLEDGQRQGSINIFEIKMAIAAAHRVKEPGPITLLGEAAAAYAAMPNKGALEIEFALKQMSSISASANCLSPTVRAGLVEDLGYMMAHMETIQALEAAEADQDQDDARLKELRLAGAI